jgi:hypothetical protein
MSTWIVGDVHGCAAELADLASRIGPTGDDRLLLVGDLFDKGPDPVGVLHVMDELGARAVLGNHDVLVRDQGRARLGRGPANGKPAPYLAACLDALERAGELERAVQLCEQLPLLLRPLEGWIVVHGGVNPREGTDGTDEKMATTLREFPRGGGVKWWKQWTGPDAVVFGHDARQGLVDHRREGGAPLAIGLDTGCVYGGVLTAYSPEEDRFLQVPARRTWHEKA